MDSRNGHDGSGEPHVRSKAESVGVAVQVCTDLLRCGIFVSALRVGEIRKAVDVAGIIRPESRIGAVRMPGTTEVGLLLDDIDLESVGEEDLCGSQTRNTGADDAHTIAVHQHRFDFCNKRPMKMKIPLYFSSGGPAWNKCFTKCRLPLP